MLVYTVTDRGRSQSYEGFRRVWANGPSQVIATAFVDGEGDWWEIDPANVRLAVEELQRFYRAEHGLDNVEIIVYDRRSP